RSGRCGRSSTWMWNFLPICNSARRDSSLGSKLPPFIPASRIEDQSLPWGKCFTSASEGQEFHLYEDQPSYQRPLGLRPPSLTTRVISEERVAAIRILTRSPDRSAPRAALAHSKRSGP